MTGMLSWLISGLLLGHGRSRIGEFQGVGLLVIEIGSVHARSAHGLEEALPAGATHRAGAVSRGITAVDHSALAQLFHLEVEQLLAMFRVGREDRLHRRGVVAGRAVAPTLAAGIDEAGDGVVVLR